ncbi:MAG: hypothetical protein IKU47_06985 [Oscillospiraceae bacterium]|nr:hypothetical protein [Oscillospiraceae bacterium]
MKKNKMMRLASGLLVAVLITTSTISGTYAKYVTEASGTDSARVAKFGVTITAAEEMFSDSYKDAKTTYNASEEGDAITVQADTEGTNVVAPGTNGSLVGFAVTGTPEVDVRVTYEPNLALDGWEVDSAYYCPIVIKVGTEEFDGTEYASMTAFETAVEEAIVAKTADYDANTNLSVVNDDVVVTWTWGYEAGDAAAGQTDALDTKLGNQAAAGSAATIALTVKTTITQID